MKCCPIKADGSRLDVPGGIYLFSCIISALSLVLQQLMALNLETLPVRLGRIPRCYLCKNMVMRRHISF